MTKRRSSTDTHKSGGATVGSKIAAVAGLVALVDGRRGVQALVLGLIFLKYISDAFEERHAELEADEKLRAPTQRIRTSIARRTSSGFRRKRDGCS